MTPCFKAIELYKEYNTANPYELCDYLGIHVVKHDLPINIKGFFQCIYDEYIIFVNSNLEQTNPVVCHELGHILMHSHLNTVFLEDHTRFVVNRFENEADLFAATLLMLDLDPETYIYELFNMSFFSNEIIEKVVKFKQENIKDNTYCLFDWQIVKNFLIKQLKNIPIVWYN